MTINEAIKQHRGKARMSLRALEARCSVDKSQLSRIETGKISPRVEQVESIARGLGYVVSVTWKREARRG